MTAQMTAQEVSNALVEGLKNAEASIVRVDGRRSYPLSGTVWSENTIVTTSRAVEQGEAKVTLAGGGDTHSYPHWARPQHRSGTS